MVNHTKEELGNALKRVMKRKSLNKITISDITNECGVNRMTFYYHFQDIYDLVEWICCHDTELTIGENKSYKSSTDGITAVFDLLQENKVFVMGVYRSVSRDIIEGYFYKVCETVFSDILNDIAKDNNIDEKYKSFMIDFHKYALVGVVISWINNNMKEDKAEIISNLKTLLGTNIADAVERFSALSNNKTAV